MALGDSMLIALPLTLLTLSILSSSARVEAAGPKDDGFFFGQSPPVYPSPPMTGGEEWKDAYLRARSMVDDMTLEEKISLTGGVKLGTGCSGSVTPIPRLGFPGMCLSDAGNGLRGTDLVNAYPSGIHVGASWNKALARRRGMAMAREFRKKGVNVLLGPVVGPAWRVVRGGRNWEGFSVDPYLAGSLVSETVEGIQGEGVQASVKHFIANEQEDYRSSSLFGEAVSSNIDDKTMHELYMWPFQDAVKAGCGNIMCSYNRINNSYGCANSKTLNGLLKTELGFQGFVVSDWGAQHAGVATALAGLDLAMPMGDEFWGQKLVEAVKNGSVPERRVDDMVSRLLTTWFQFKQNDSVPHPGVGMPANVVKPHLLVEGREEGALPILLEGAIEGHVLVKNSKRTLPLKRPRMLSVFGYSAKSADDWGPSHDFIQLNTWMFGLSPLDPASRLASILPTAKRSPIARMGTLIGGGGSGAVTPAVFTSPLESLKVRAARDDTALFYDLSSEKPAVDPLSEACIVLGNAWASEGYDRPSLSDNYTDGLIRTVADQCSRTIVVLHNAGVRLVDGFVHHPNVTAVVFAHLPGRDSGEALVSLLYGEASPSGKLPYTVARREADYGHVLGPDLPRGEYKNFPQSDFGEGTLLDYRRFDREGIEPRYEFGFGLSYTRFELSGLGIRKTTPTTRPLKPYPTGAVVAGGQSDLWEVLAFVEAKVRNTGDVDGAEVAQMYVGFPRGSNNNGDDSNDAVVSIRQLRGFEKTRILRPGEEQRVRFGLTRRDLSEWDVGAQRWRLVGGGYDIFVGNSSRSLPLRGNLEL
ncbi:hypothetical protein L249_1082 [Ophiocordyceps polyrhachis-furcata BCC 54312]|uniref:beta-glucosidase n=1 Tax=Ophiocordyceps polyrhachis-furcata BCC 54312 TaxID=1330021 RepID=A0A367LF62_9HYPO|nr:hypothetical protein L249_1082 [Ophiocordyceps polyrhachis-furcata BCC 54312]